MTNTAAKISENLRYENLLPGNLFGQQNKAKEKNIQSEIKPSLLSSNLEDLARLVANLSESHTATIYLADLSKRVLKLGSVHTLSRDFASQAEIPFGAGLIGWTAENELRISVSPFEHDAKTLLCYNKDQDLKSFIAIPIHCAEKSLLGVIACDSKKSYAFSKVTEKILFDCARQAANLIALHKKSRTAGAKEDVVFKNDLLSLAEQLRTSDSENKLLSTSASIPQSIVSRAALIIVNNAESGIGQEMYYSADAENDASHQLLEIICKNKKILHGDSRIQVLPTQDIKERSFLNIPLRSLGKTVGSINLLSKNNESFSAKDISNLEQIAKVVGRELERIRLKDKFNSGWESTSNLSWKHFEIRAKHWLKEAEENRNPLSLVRFKLKNLEELEANFGPAAACKALQKLMRLLDQVKSHPALTCYMYGSHILLLCESANLKTTLNRLEKLIQRLSPEDLEIKFSSTKVGKLIEDNLAIKIADTLNEDYQIKNLLNTTLMN